MFLCSLEQCIFGDQFFFLQHWKKQVDQSWIKSKQRLFLNYQLTLHLNYSSTKESMSVEGCVGVEHYVSWTMASRGRGQSILFVCSLKREERFLHREFKLCAVTTFYWLNSTKSVHSHNIRITFSGMSTEILLTEPTGPLLDTVIGYPFTQLYGSTVKGQTHGWQAGVPGRRVVAARADADVASVDLRGAQPMWDPVILRVFTLLPLHAGQHLQFRRAQATWLVFSPVVFLRKETKLHLQKLA